jgi:hypothetical protein
VKVAPDNAYVVRIQTLERREADLVSRLEQCIPPVDQHRADLERVRSELAAARDTHV